MLPRRFTVRVYGLLFNDNQQVLVSHEKIGDFAFSKFPGGGLEFGESPIDCLLREFKEETGLDVVPGRHVYTTDVFVQSRFVPEEQVIGIYYEIKAVNPAILASVGFELSIQDFKGTENQIRHEWIGIYELNPDMLTFEMDRRAWEAYREGW